MSRESVLYEQLERVTDIVKRRDRTIREAEGHLRRIDSVLLEARDEVRHALEMIEEGRQ